MLVLHHLLAPSKIVAIHEAVCEDVSGALVATASLLVNLFLVCDATICAESRRQRKSQTDCNTNTI